MVARNRQTRADQKMARRRRRTALSLANIVKTILFLALIAVIVWWLEQTNRQVFVGRAWVVDGDTIIIDREKLRLSGIDAPEIAQSCTRSGKPWPCGREAKKALRKLALRGDFQCTTEGLDRYERWLATCSVQGANVNRTLVRNGWAVNYGGYGPYGGEETLAQNEKVGIWQGQFDQPQNWRRLNRSDAALVQGAQHKGIDVITNRARGLWRSLSKTWSER